MDRKKKYQISYLEPISKGWKKGLSANNGVYCSNKTRVMKIGYVNIDSGQT